MPEYLIQSNTLCAAQAREICLRVGKETFQVIGGEHSTGRYCYVPQLSMGFEIEDPDNVYHTVSMILNANPKMLYEAKAIAHAIKDTWGTSGPIPEEESRKHPWRMVLQLTTRAYNALCSRNRNKDATIGDLADISKSQILLIRNIGPMTRAEIANALYDAGIRNSDWFLFLKDTSADCAGDDKNDWDCTDPAAYMEKYFWESEYQDIWRTWSDAFVGSVSSKLLQLERSGLLTPDNIKKLKAALKENGHISNPCLIISRPLEDKA